MYVYHVQVTWFGTLKIYYSLSTFVAVAYDRTVLSYAADDRTQRFRKTPPTL